MFWLPLRQTVVPAVISVIQVLFLLQTPGVAGPNVPWGIIHVSDEFKRHWFGQSVGKRPRETQIVKWTTMAITYANAPSQILKFEQEKHEDETKETQQSKQTKKQTSNKNKETKSKTNNPNKRRTSEPVRASFGTNKIPSPPFPSVSRLKIDCTKSWIPTSNSNRPHMKTHRNNSPPPKNTHKTSQKLFLMAPHFKKNHQKTQKTNKKKKQVFAADHPQQPSAIHSPSLLSRWKPRRIQRSSPTPRVSPPLGPSPHRKAGGEKAGWGWKGFCFFWGGDLGRVRVRGCFCWGALGGRGSVYMFVVFFGGRLTGGVCLFALRLQGVVQNLQVFFAAGPGWVGGLSRSLDFGGYFCMFVVLFGGT